MPCRLPASCTTSMQLLPRSCTVMRIRLAIWGQNSVRIIQRLTCILHHLDAALAQVLHCHANTIGSLGTEQCALYRGRPASCTTSTQLLPRSCTVMQIQLVIWEQNSMHIIQRLICILHHLYTLAQVLHCHADMTSNLGTEPCVHYTEADLHPAPPLYWQSGDLKVCTLEAGLETGKVCVCVCVCVCVWVGGCMRTHRCMHARCHCYVYCQTK